MSRDEIIQRVMSVLQDALDNDDIVYRDDLTAKDVAEWDSLSNIRLMVAIERAFKTKFTAGEWQGLKQLGDLVDMLAARQ